MLNPTKKIVCHFVILLFFYVLSIFKPALSLFMCSSYQSSSSLPFVCLHICQYSWCIEVNDCPNNNLHTQLIKNSLVSGSTLQTMSL